jgi:hypothetical protein
LPIQYKAKSTIVVSSWDNVKGQAAYIAAGSPAKTDLASRFGT